MYFKKHFWLLNMWHPPCQSWSFQRGENSLWKYTYDLCSKDKSMVPKKMLMEVVIRKASLCTQIFFVSYPTGTWKIIPRSDLGLMNWANTFPGQKTGLWLLTVCVTWKTLNWLAGTVILRLKPFLFQTAESCIPGITGMPKSNFQHSKILRNWKPNIWGES